MLRSVILLFALLLTVGCDSTFDASRLGNDLANSSWLFERAETDDGDINNAPELSRLAMIDFGDRAENSTSYEVSGYNGCNAFSGKYSVDGNELQFSEIVQTERACMEAEARIEEVFNRGILGAKNFSFEGDVLVIDAPGQSVKLRLTRVSG